MVTLYNVLSEDGFIARGNGEEDFIPDELWSHTLEFFKLYDALAMGRKTYEVLQAYEPELLQPFEALPLKKIVITRDPSFAPKSGYIVARSLREALASGQNVLVSSGPNVNSQLLREGLADKVIWQILPIKIGEGIRPFEGNLEKCLEQVEEHKGPLQTKLIEYHPVLSLPA